MSIERLAVMFAGCTAYHPAEAIGAGHRAALNRVEVAALMAGLNRAERDYVYAYFGDESGELRLLAHVRYWLADLAGRESWKVLPGRPLVCNLAAVAVFESVRPNVCGCCRGTGVRMKLPPVHPWDYRTCHHCAGGGHMRLSNRRIAEAMGIDEAAFRRTWSGRYERAFGYVRSIESEVNSVIRRAQSDDGVLMA